MWTRRYIPHLLVFSEQDVVKDPPLSRLDLLSCRNLLIYLNADLQRKLMGMFNYALAPGGALFLATSEYPGESARAHVPGDRSQAEGRGLLTRTRGAGKRSAAPASAQFGV